VGLHRPQTQSDYELLTRAAPRSFAQEGGPPGNKQLPMTKAEDDQSLWNLTRRAQVAARVVRARGLWNLTVGLLGRPPLRRREALWLEPCGSIHTWGMRYAIDVVFLNRDGRVLGVARQVKPWRIALAPPRTRSALELRAGEASGVEVGDQLELAEVSVR
jgi:hypothetical protein